MKISVFGILPFSQLIKEGFNDLGHEISKEKPDIIFSNDPRGYKDAISLKIKYPKSFLILNLLDIPWHMPNIQKQTQLLVSAFLDKADAITVISFKVKRDLQKFLNKKLFVIYNPRRDVYYDRDIKKNDMFLFVGRANDPVKRFELIRESLSKIKNGNQNIKICGSEDPNFGSYQGYVSDQKLNELYNSSRYVLLPSIAEGIGLPMIEGMICGCIPITCSDNDTAKEFSPPDFICDPNPQSIINKIENLNKNYTKNMKLALEYGNKYIDQFNKINIAKNILNVKK